MEDFHFARNTILYYHNQVLFFTVVQLLQRVLTCLCTACTHATNHNLSPELPAR